MSSIRLSGTSSGYYDLTVPAAAGTNSIDLSKLTKQDSNGNITVSHSAAGGAVQAIILNSNGVATVGNEARLHLGATGTGSHGSVLISEFTGVANTNHRTDLIIQTTPGSSVLREHMRIDGDGRVTTPHQPAFHAQPTNAPATSEITSYIVRYNNGNHFNGTNGRFTAPVTGTYYFNFFGMTASAGTFDVSLWTNGADDNHMVPYQSATGGTHVSSSGGIVKRLNSGDYVTLRNNNTALYSTGTGRHLGFCGFLIG